MKKLGDIGKIITGNTPKTSDPKNYETRSICFVKPSDIAEDKITRILCSEFYISEYAREKARIVPPESVLVTCIGSIGKVAISGIECAINQQINAIIPDSSKCNAEYLAYLIQYKKSELQLMANAPVVPILNKSQFSELNIELPSLDEQKIVNEKLNKITNIISLRQQQLAKLDELVKARFVEMFGDPMINSMHWPIYELSEYIQFLTSGSRGWAKYFTDEGEYFITIKNVKNCKITLDDVQHIAPPDNAEAKRTKVQAGDLLISITADLGRTGVVTQEIAEHGAYINQHLTCIRLNQSVVLPLYVAYYMESDAGKKQFQLKNQTGVKAGLNFNSINTLKVMAPPLEKQRSFVSFVEQVEKTKSSIQKNLKKIEILKKALVQRYFG